MGELGRYKSRLEQFGVILMKEEMVIADKCHTTGRFMNGHNISVTSKHRYLKLC